MGHLSFTTQQIVERQDDREMPVRLPIESINLLTQVRQSISNIDELAESIRTQGQLAQGVAVAFTKAQVKNYLCEINDIRSTSHTVGDLHPVMIDSKEYYILLIAGHRRYYAVKYLHEISALFTQKCDGLYRCILHFGMSARQALAIQFQENRHNAVPLHEEAAAAWDYYRWQKKSNPSLTLAAFGRSIGRSASWVKNAVRFCSLPDSLQKYAGDGEVTIPYGILTEAARYSEGLKSMGHPIDDQFLEKMVIDTVVKRTTVAKFREMVSSRLKHLGNGQESLFSELPEQEKPVRRQVAPQMTQGLWAFLTYLDQLGALKADGAFGKDGHLEIETSAKTLGEYSPGSPIHLSAQLAKRLQDLLPDLQKLAQENGGRHLKDLKDSDSVIEEAADLLADLKNSEEFFAE